MLKEVKKNIGSIPLPGSVNGVYCWPRPIHIRTKSVQIDFVQSC